MLWKPAEPFLSITPSGCPQLYAWEMMHLQLTLRWPLGQNLQLGHMVQLETQPQTFCSSKGLVQSPVGLMITYSSGSHVVHFQSTTRNAGHGMETSYPEVSTKMEVESGSEEGGLKIGTLEEFNKDCTFPCKDLSVPSDWPAEDRSYTYNFDDIDTASWLLGIPWEVSKDRPFTSSTTYISFDWNIKTNRVSLADSKKEKYLTATKNWLSQTSHMLEEVEKLYSKLLHACLVRPTGQAYLTELECMLGIFHDSPLIPQSKGTSKRPGMVG